MLRRDYNPHVASSLFASSRSSMIVSPPRGSSRRGMLWRVGMRDGWSDAMNVVIAEPYHAIVPAHPHTFKQTGRSFVLSGRAVLRLSAYPTGLLICRSPNRHAGPAVESVPFCRSAKHHRAGSACSETGTYKVFATGHPYFSSQLQTTMWLPECHGLLLKHCKNAV